MCKDNLDIITNIMMEIHWPVQKIQNSKIWGRAGRGRGAYLGP